MPFWAIHTYRGHNVLSLRIRLWLGSASRANRHRCSSQSQIVKENWSNKPDDFLASTGNPEKHVKDKKLLHHLKRE